jgi:hypothetical protein
VKNKIYPGKSLAAANNLRVITKFGTERQLFGKVKMKYNPPVNRTISLTSIA